MLPPLSAIRDRRQAFAEKPDTIRQVLTDGSRRARAIALDVRPEGVGRDDREARVDPARGQLAADLGLARNTRSSDEWPEFEPGNATILLSTPEQTGTPFRPSNYSVALRVPDVAPAQQKHRAELTA